jgi:hypothetical protein
LWDHAFLEQARSDWETYSLIAKSHCAECHNLHYLQMTTEKLGKAMLLKSGSGIQDVRQSHRAFVRFLQLSARTPRIRETLGMDYRQLKSHIDSILPLAERIERIVPGIDNFGPNPEYPWENPSGEIKVPASYSFPEMRELNSPDGRKLLGLIAVFINKFEYIF